MVRGVVPTLAFVSVLMVGVPSGAVEAEDVRARTLFDEGKAAYDRNEYQVAYDRFKQAYLLSHKPMLLYNMASCQQKFRRPHEAAETLRSFLRAMPDDPD